MLRPFVDVSRLQAKDVCNGVEMVDLVRARWHVCDKHGRDLHLVLAACCLGQAVDPDDTLR